MIRTPRPPLYLRLTEEQTKMFDDNMELALRCANHWSAICDNWLYKEDIQQEALLGLALGVKKYDKTKGIQFSTFAYTCMKNRIRNFLGEMKYETVEHASSTRSLDGSVSDPSGDFSEFKLSCVIENNQHQVLSDILYSEEAVVEFLTSLKVDSKYIEWTVLYLFHDKTQAEIGREENCSGTFTSAVILGCRRLLACYMKGYDVYYCKRRYYIQMNNEDYSVTYTDLCRSKLPNNHPDPLVVARGDYRRGAELAERIYRQSLLQKAQEREERARLRQERRLKREAIEKARIASFNSARSSDRAPTSNATTNGLAPDSE